MGRKVFLSVLGSTNYGSCYYVDNSLNYKSSETRFVQEASLELIKATEWPNDSTGFVFVTTGENGSFERNWEDNGHKDRASKGVIINEGLNSRINRLNLSFEVKPIEIAHGNNEKEIWQIFDTIYSCLKSNDEVYFDITHGFRYLPMLVLVLNNYSKFLLNTSIKRITYGNFESRNLITNEAPLIDLTSFSVLQDWTNGINTFLKNGDAHLIKQLLENDTNQNVLNPTIVKQFANKLSEFSELFSTIRGRKIVEGKIFNDLINLIKGMKRNVNIPQLNPLLEKINVEISKFKTSKDISNGITAIDWCNKHGLFQQSITLLQENIVSLFIETYDNTFKGVISAINDNNTNERKPNSKKEVRLYAASLLGIVNTDQSQAENRKGLAGNKCLKQFTEYLLFEPFCSEFGALYQKISHYRNSINHGGMIDDIQSKEFEEKATEFYSEIKGLILKKNNPCS